MNQPKYTTVFKLCLIAHHSTYHYKPGLLQQLLHMLLHNTALQHNSESHNR